MSVLRYLALVALSVWVGGLAALGMAAPVLFGVLETRDPSAGRELGGLLFGAVFQQFQHVAWGLGLALLVSLGLRAAIGPQPARFRLRMWVAAAMLAVSLATALAITPRIDDIRASVVGPIASLRDNDNRKIAFNRLHGLANGLMIVTVVLGLGLIWAEMRDQT